MSSASQEEPYDVLDGFFGEFDHLARGFQAPRKKTPAQKLGAAASGDLTILLNAYSPQ